MLRHCRDSIYYQTSLIFLVRLQRIIKLYQAKLHYGSHFLSLTAVNVLRKVSSRQTNIIISGYNDFWAHKNIIVSNR